MRFLLSLLFVIALLPPAQAPRPRLLIIGDSISFGLAASEEAQTYRHLLAVALDADVTYIRATTLADAPETIPGADIIVIEIGLNDVLEGDAAPIQEADWPAAYGATLDRLQSVAPLVVAATPMHALYRAHPEYDKMERYAGYIREQAGARGIALADLWAIQGCVPACLSQEEDTTPFPPYHGDNFHPNSRGHARIADVVMQAIRPTRTYIPFYIAQQE